MRTSILVLLSASVMLTACNPSPEETVETPTPTPELSIQTGGQDMPEDLQVEVIEEGTGEEAATGSAVTVHYTGTFTDGSKFDSSRDRGTPFTFTLGKGEVISGWDQGVLGMKVGERRILTVPPELGYGNRQVGPIPAGSTLVFEIELLEVTSSQ